MSKSIFELPVGLANPMVLIDRKSIFELPVGLPNLIVLIDIKSMFELPVDLANPMVLIGDFIHWYKIYSEKCPVGLANSKGFPF